MTHATESTSTLDEDLRLAQAGEATWTNFVNAHHQHVKNIVTRLCIRFGVAHSLFDDMQQETICRMIDPEVRRCRIDEPARRYIGGLAMDSIAFKKSQRRLEIEETAGDDWANNSVAMPVDMHAQFEAAEALSALFGRVTERQRQICNEMYGGKVVAGAKVGRRLEVSKATVSRELAAIRRVAISLGLGAQ